MFQLAVDPSSSYSPILLHKDDSQESLERTGKHPTILGIPRLTPPTATPVSLGVPINHNFLFFNMIRMCRRRSWQWPLMRASLSGLTVAPPPAPTLPIGSLTSWHPCCLLGSGVAEVEVPRTPKPSRTLSRITFGTSSNRCPDVNSDSMFV